MLERAAGLRSAAAIACLVWCLFASIVVTGGFWTGRVKIDTDIQSVLPSGASDPVVRAAMDRAGETSAARIALLVEAEDPLLASEAGAALEEALAATGLFTSDRADAEATGKWLFAHRNELLCERDPRTFDAAAAETVARQGYAAAFSPIAPVSSAMLASDPFLLTLRLSRCLTPSAARNPTQGSLVSGRLEASAYRIDVQQKIVRAVDSWKRAWAPKGVTVARAGAAFHADWSAERTKTEVGVIGAIGGLGVIALFWLAFRRFKSVLVAVASVYVGLVGGLAVALMLFGKVHVLVFMFGATLIGVVSDYTVHFLATGPAGRWPDMRARLGQVARPITVSMATTAMGFAALALFRVPLFDQVAAFAVAGLLTAWAFVLTVLPSIDAKPRNAEALSAWWAKLEDWRARIRVPPAVSIGFSVLLGALVLVGAYRARPVDDPRAFQPRPEALMREQARVHAQGAETFAPAFFLSRGRTGEEALRREEAVIAVLSEDAPVLASSRIAPSAARRDENARALQEQLFPLAARQVSRLGLSPSEVDLGRGADGKALPPDWATALRGTAAGTAFLVAPVLGPPIEAPPLEGVSLVEPVEQFKRAFAAYRVYAAAALVAAIVAAAAVLLGAYRRVEALSILVAPIVGVASGLYVPLAFGADMSFFSIVAGLVLLGVGIDYSAFQWEAGRVEASRGATDRWTAVAVGIDAATTGLSMGLLALSATLPVKAFGVTVAVGVAAAMIFSYVPRHVARRAG